MEKKPQLIGFINSFSHGKSGGDMVFIEIVKRMSGYEKNIVTSLLGKELCLSAGLKGRYYITTDEKEFHKVIMTYMKRIIKALLMRFDMNKEDVVLSSSDFLPDVLPAFLLKRKQKGALWVQHIFHLIPKSRILSYINQKISFSLIRRNADLIFVDNSILKEDLIRLGFRRDVLFVNYAGIGHDSLRKIKATDDSCYDGVFMAQLRPTKGIFDLIKIWKMVCQSFPHAQLGVIGKGSKEIIDRFLDDCKKESMDKNIHFLGYLPDSQAYATIKTSKIFIFPSHEEGFGIAPLEAQALGVPVVAWNLPVYKEIFLKGMLKVRMGEFTQFSSKIISLLSNKSLHSKLHYESIQNARRFSWNKTASVEKRIIERFSVS